jgi:hypothetical protein
VLCLTGQTLTTAADARQRMGLAAAAALAFGAATFTNYLAAFVGLACVLWLMRRWRLGVAAAIGGVVWLPVVGWFALGQFQARPSQFPPFEAIPALIRLLRYQAAAVFGGLPLYAGPAAGLAEAAIGIVAALLAGALLWRWRTVATAPHRWLLAMVAVAPAAGLLALGLLSGRAPIELRYLVFGLPAIALLMAGATARRRALLWFTLGVQAAAIAGLMLRPETMQPQGAAAAAARLPPDTLVLVPQRWRRRRRRFRRRSTRPVAAAPGRDQRHAGQPAPRGRGRNPGRRRPAGAGRRQPPRGRGIARRPDRRLLAPDHARRDVAGLGTALR